MSYEEFQLAEEAASQAELEQLSLLSTAELVDRIQRGRFGQYNRAFAALASKKDLGAAGPVLARQLQGSLSFAQRLGCAHALLSLLPYSGIPDYAIADRSHRGHGIYTQDLEALLQRSLNALQDRRDD